MSNEAPERVWLEPDGYVELWDTEGIRVHKDAGPTIGSDLLYEYVRKDIYDAVVKELNK